MREDGYGAGLAIGGGDKTGWGGADSVAREHDASGFSSPRGGDGYLEGDGWGIGLRAGIGTYWGTTEGDDGDELIAYEYDT